MLLEPRSWARRGLPAAFLAATVLGAANPYVTPHLDAARQPAPGAAAPGPVAPGPAAPACSNTTRLAGWTNGRLAMETIAVPVEESSPGEVSAEVAHGAGGVLLFGTSAPRNLGALLTSLRRKVPGHLGLLVMADEEGGGVQRMANLVGSLPWPQTVGAAWTPAHIEKAVAAVARRMAAAGVDMDLAPVVDVDGRRVEPGNSDPDGYRSFGASTGLVSRDALAYARGLEEGHVIPVFKHFPGLGGASGNTDVEPARTLPWKVLRRVALPPYLAGVKEGIPAIMVSNATVPGLASYPASLSPAAIRRELQTALGYRGLVLTDSLSAVAITRHWSVPQAAVQALMAGADMLLFSLVPDVAAETAAIDSAIVSAVAAGRLPRARLIAAAAAVLSVRHVDLCAS